MKKYFIAFMFTLVLLISCGDGKSASSSKDLVGIWQEYRADVTDNYGLSTWKFNKDGSGLFTVEGASNTQKVSFMWEKVNSNTIRITMNGSSSKLELNNGMLIEKSASGTIVFKKK